MLLCEDVSLWSLCEVKINDMSVEHVNEFVYLGSLFTRDGKIVTGSISTRNKYKGLAECSGEV